jgi:trans-2,3-dihydro-3-hydroxyanthranilate isomerase
MQRRYVTVDVFTDRAFGGNPLAVVLDANRLSTAQMRPIW